MSQFTWEPFYKELSEKVLEDKESGGANIKNHLVDALKLSGQKLNNIVNFSEVDPFTFFACFNGYISAQKKREKILKELQKSLNIKTDLPQDFDGVPMAGNPMKAWFADGNKGNANARKILWDLFENAINYADNGSDENLFKKNYDKAINIKNVGWRLSMVLFMIRPNAFISLDWLCRKKLNSDYGIKPNNTGEEYLELCKTVKQKIGDFKMFSLEAWNDKKNTDNNSNTITNNRNINEYKNKLLKMHNVIFRGAPGTGKTYLAQQLATYVVSNGSKNNYDDLNEEERSQIEFVQFHPSYDYTDFVEGLRPSVVNGNVTFKLENGIFKKFCRKAIDAMKPGGVDNFDDAWTKLINKINNSTNNSFVITTKSQTNMELELQDDGEGLRKKGDTGGFYFNKNQLYKVYKGQKGVPSGAFDNYRELIIKWMKNNVELKDYTEGDDKNIQEAKKYVIIIDEINRGEISKIFGELFFSIDPGYRGKKGMVSTQYSNMHEDLKEKFYVPNNVYIVGTMNDIDRSVDTFDFAMRRRFAFIHISAKESQAMLTDKALINRMNNLNEAICKIPELNENYQIGASYFRKVLNNELSVEELWDYYLEPLLRDYLQGMNDVDKTIAELKKEYNNDNEKTKGSESSEIINNLDNE